MLEGGEGIRQEVDFDRELRLLQSSYFHADELVMRVEYGKFGGNPEFPRSVFIETPGQRTEATIDFSEVAINVAIPPERFILAPPPGYAVEPLP
jgi:outer membrane lipoprotein-sorting protein